ncbi:MAG: DNA alkylation repair protein [Chlorobi bacterium]|nr:DNA alkylation repair protein [Chlorobiota bacterium]
MQYIKPIITEYEKHRNAANALPMSNYMKNNFAFLGIKSPDRKVINRAFFKKYGLPEISNLTAIIKKLWQLPEREYQYFAMELMKRCFKKTDDNIIDLLEYMIINKSWWDSIDLIATHLVGVFFQKYNNLVPGKTTEWMNSGNIWLQRTCILFQLKYKKETDFNLLTEFIIPLTNSKEFFIQKAIGWALREYSKTNPQMVLEFVKKHNLAPLSVREALRILKKNDLSK